MPNETETEPPVPANLPGAWRAAGGWRDAAPLNLQSQGETWSSEVAGEHIYYVYIYIYILDHYH